MTLSLITDRNGRNTAVRVQDDVSILLYHRTYQLAQQSGWSTPSAVQAQQCTYRINDVVADGFGVVREKVNGS